MRKTFRLPVTPTGMGRRHSLLGCLVGTSLLLAACEGGSPEVNSESRGEPVTSEGADADAPLPGLPPTGQWRGSLLSPGGPLTFGLEFVQEDEGLRAFLVNGPERRPAGLVETTPGGIEFALPPYRSRILATLTRMKSGGASIVGSWELDRGQEAPSVLPFAAIDNAMPPEIPELSGEEAARMSGRWAVQFEGDADPSVGIFQVERSGRATGTFLTTLGDYRYLAGYSDGTALHLSCFDGAHAFLFAALRQDDGSLSGDFWSRDSYHTTWTASKSRDAVLPDDFALTEWVGGLPLSEVRFPDASGTVRSLADDDFQAKARLLVIFGTWCPNCNDLTEYLVQLAAQYEDLSIVGIAFELGDDPEAHRKAVQDYGEHHGATYPILIGGTANKKAASEAFPLVDRVRAYPTTVFMNEQGKVSAVHTGFSGPATGEVHETLKLRFESEIESLLASD